MASDIHLQKCEHNKACKILKTQMESGSLAQAMLFVGQNDYQMRQTAKKIALGLVGEKFKTQLDNNVMPDVTFLEPYGANGYLTEQIKSVIANEKKAPLLSNSKVVIINKAQKLGVASANAFLKTLEEPASFTTFILLANNVENVLPTIVSRCQVFDFGSTAYSKNVLTLMNDTNCSKNEAQYALDVYGNDFGAAINYLSNKNLQDFSKRIQEAYNGLANKDKWDIIVCGKNIDKNITDELDFYKEQLELSQEELEEVLDNAAIREIKAQNKRKISAYKNDLLKFFCSVLEQCLREHMIDNFNFVKAEDTVNTFTDFIPYNVNAQNFIINVLLGVARDIK